MISPVLEVLIALVGAAFVGFGSALLVRGLARLSAVIGMVGGVAAIAGTVLMASGQERLGLWLISAAGLVALPLALVVHPSIDWRNPLDAIAFAVVIAGGGTALTALDNPDVAVLGWLAQVLALAVRIWWRIDREVPALRQPLLWVAAALALVLVAGGLAAFSEWADILLTVALALLGLIPAAMYLGVTRADSIDARELVVRLVVTVVTVFGYVASVMVILALGQALGVAPAGGWLALICGLLALGVHPAQAALRGVIDELIYGPSRDPLEAASALVGQAGVDPLQALQAIREGLGLPYASLVVAGEDIATSGAPPASTRSIPLSASTDGRLVVGVRDGDLDLASRDLLILGLVAPLLAQTVRANRLAADLQASREHTINAIEEERRRLRRDLHDGLGPRLSGIAYSIDAARNALALGAQADTDALLTSLREETTAAITEIRRIVYQMRPPALDELGLVGALRQQAASMRRPDGLPFGVSIQAPELPPLSAATEVAAYRIVVEALTNASRHSGGSSAAVRFDVRQGLLTATVEDAGPRASASWRPGVGLASMRERADELGGRFDVVAAPSGWRVQAVLPVGVHLPLRPADSPSGGGPE